MFHRLHHCDHFSQEIWNIFCHEYFQLLFYYSFSLLTLRFLPAFFCSVYPLIMRMYEYGSTHDHLAFYCQTNLECLSWKFTFVFHILMALLAPVYYFQIYHWQCLRLTSISVLCHFEFRFSIIPYKNYRQSKTSIHILLFYLEENYPYRNFRLGSKAHHILISSPRYILHYI